MFVKSTMRGWILPDFIFVDIYIFKHFLQNSLYFSALSVPIIRIGETSLLGILVARWITSFGEL